MRACPDCHRLISPSAVVCPHCLSRVGDGIPPTSSDQDVDRPSRSHDSRHRTCSRARDGASDRPSDDWYQDDSDRRDHNSRADHPSARERPLSDLETRCIARFGAGAEAGYFADALSRLLDIETEVVVREHREPVHGVWSNDFALLVRTEDAPRALQALRDMLLADSQQDGDEDGGYLGDWSDDEQVKTDHELTLDLVPCSSPRTSTRGRRSERRSDERPHPAAESDASPDADVEDLTRDEGPGDDTFSSTSRWFPLLITLAAGTFVYWTVEHPAQRVRRPPAPVREPDGQLWDAMTQSPEPWTQRQPQGGGIRELRFDLQRGTAILREDLDGDGTIDRERSVSLER